MKCRVSPTTSRGRASYRCSRRKSSEATLRVSRSPSPRSFPAANVHRHQRIEVRRLHHHIDFDLFVSCADAPAARADLDGWYPQLVVDVGVGPDAGAVRRFRLDLFAEQVLVDFFCRLDQRLDILSLVTEERFVDVHLVIKAEFVEGLLQFILDRDRADVRKYAYVDVDGTNAGEVVRPVGPSIAPILALGSNGPVGEL